MTGLGQDLRFALRGLRRNPGFTTTALLVLALGIGANTAIFSVVDALVLRPLPFPGGDRLISVRARNLDRGTLGPISAPDVQDLRQDVPSFEAVASYRQRGVVLTGQGDAQMLQAVFASADLFQVLGVAPVLGRAFQRGEDQPGQPAVAVLSHGFWQARLGGDPGVLNRVLNVDGQSVRVIGVAPAWFRFPLDGPATALWMALHGPFDQEARRWRSMHPYRGAVARLRPGVGLAAAQTELDTLSARLASTFPKDKGGYVFAGTPVADDFGGRARPALLVLLGAVALVLLIACANLANLQLARAAVRSREIAIRGALGAGRGRIIRQLLTESLLLALLGAGLGLALAAAVLRVGVVTIPEEIARPHAIAVDGRVLLFTLVVAGAAGVLSGLAPALVASQPGTLRTQADRSRTGDWRLGPPLLMAEVALAVVLVIGAGLLVRSFGRVTAVDPGFDATGLLTARIKTGARVTTDRSLHRDLLARVRALPGVQSATVASPLPFSGFLDGGMHFTLDDRPAPSPGAIWMFNWHNVATNYFGTLGIPLVQGRSFQASDEHPQARAVAVINQSFARKYWPQGSPIGRRVMAYNRFDWLVVGVVGDVRGQRCPLSGCAGDGHGSLERPAEPVLYSVMRSCCSPDLHLAVRVANPAATAPALRALVRQVDPGLAVQEIRSMQDLIDGTLASRRLSLGLLSLFAGLALLLAVIGIYGVLSYTVSQRTRELAIRMALGARAAALRGLVLGQGLRVAVLGLALGLLASLAITRVLASQLYGVSATDPLTFAVLVALVLLASVAASLLPARRATRIDPMIALRSE